MAITEARADILVNRTAGAIKRYQTIASLDSRAGDLAVMGTMLVNWRKGANDRRHGWSFGTDPETDAIRAVARYSEGTRRNLVFIAGSPRGETVRDPEELLQEWHTVAGILPYAEVIFQRRRGSKSEKLSNVACVRFELQPDGIDLSTITTVSVGADSRVVPDKVQGVSVEAATTLEVAEMYRGIFSMAGNN